MTSGVTGPVRHRFCLCHVIALLPALVPPVLAQPPADQEPRTWTVMFYGAVDNDAEGPFVEGLTQMPAFLGGIVGLEVLVFVDRHPGESSIEIEGEDFSDSRVYRVTGGALERLAGGETFPELDREGGFEADSSDPAVLGKFIRLAKERYPADHHALVLYGHANGAILLPDSSCQSEGAGVAALSHSLDSSHRVDLLVLDICLMGGIEVAYEWRPGVNRFGADYMLAIPNAGEALPWGPIVKKLSAEGMIAGLSPEAFGRSLRPRQAPGQRAELRRNDPERRDPAVPQPRRPGSGLFRDARARRLRTRPSRHLRGDRPRSGLGRFRLVRPPAGQGAVLRSLLDLP